MEKINQYRLLGVVIPIGAVGHELPLVHSQEPPFARLGYSETCWMTPTTLLKLPFACWLIWLAAHV